MSARALHRGGIGAAALLALSGCCRMLSLDSDGPEPEPVSTIPAEELGTLVYPPDAPPERAAIHTWNAKRLKPSTYRLGYALSSDEGSAIEDSLSSFADKVGYQHEGKGKFRWIPPSGCSGDMHCVFESIVARNMDDIAPIAERFRQRQRAAKLSTLDLAALVVTFVQNIKYEVPDKAPFGLLPPALVVSQKRGDCDSKSLLAHMILRSLGIDALLVSSTAHRHTMLGIALPASGTRITYAGRDYAFTEMTARGSPIGHINAPLLKPNDWRPVPVRYPGGATGVSPGPKSTGGARTPTPKKKR